MNTINYQNQTIIQNPVTLPVEDTISPQEQAQAREERLDNAIGLQEELQMQADEQRQLLVASVARQSRQTQTEIYLAVALEQDVNLQKETHYMLESLQRTQDQNNAVRAYAVYAEGNEVIQLRF